MGNEERLGTWITWRHECGGKYGVLCDDSVRIWASPSCFRYDSIGSGVVSKDLLWPGTYLYQESEINI